jgi:hypothetical protein
MRQAAAFVTVLVAAAVLAGCIHDRSGDLRKHYVSFNVAPPEGDAVEVCHAYTCKMKTTYYFHKSDIAELAALMKRTKKADTPFEERRAIAYAIARIKMKGRATRPRKSATTKPPTPQATC